MSLQNTGPLFQQTLSRSEGEGNILHASHGETEQNANIQTFNLVLQHTNRRNKLSQVVPEYADWETSKAIR